MILFMTGHACLWRRRVKRLSNSVSEFACKKEDRRESECCGAPSVDIGIAQVCLDDPVGVIRAASIRPRAVAYQRKDDPILEAGHFESRTDLMKLSAFGTRHCFR